MTASTYGKIAYMVGTVLSIAGCQTTAVGLTTPNASLAREIASRNCAIGNKKSGIFRATTEINPSEIYVYSVTEKKNGWKIANFSTPMLRSRVNLYFNTETAEFACGTDNWRELSDSPVTKQMPKTFLITPNQGLRASASPSNVQKQAIAVQWDGFSHLMSGVIEETRKGKGGDIKVILPDNQGTCLGRYNYTQEGKGNWSIACANNLAASGSFTAFGDGKGTIGKGFDARGREVLYMMAGAL
ncbi:hypothetical protein [Varunaivibrio sulfuroxidans]|uniref:Uncharacterized protein n=1 Tax=Varunaivibrio sulfuroxidans TaxID=1773489 RepID=A0A4R3JBF5_9PROT|nr:hypothetical protein [Varunaivibrio sulfuroxidans]TCS62625.1 hypothetical protein EDD55_105173 [Varunaivibrio sulfuroxidans]WES30708.1 hypothetical protein P3M64_13905 [Varunaivibrio sulfuroxidans]